MNVLVNLIYLGKARPYIVRKMLEEPFNFNRRPSNNLFKYSRAVVPN